MDDLVKIINTSEGDTARDLKLDFQGTKYVIVPGAERIVRFEVAESFFGHPGARDTGKDKNRRVLYDQLRHMWGYYLGFDTQEDWAAKAPPYRVETLDGEHLPMVLEDPEGTLPLPGELVNAAPTDTTEQVALLEAQIARQQAQMDQLIAAVANLTVAQTAGLPADGGSVVPATSPAAGSGEPVGVEASAGVTATGLDGSIPAAPADEAPPEPDKPRSQRASARVG